MALQQPAGVVLGNKGLQSHIQLLNRLEVLQPQKLLFQGLVEPLDYAVAFGLTDKGGARRDAQKVQLLLNEALGSAARRS